MMNENLVIIGGNLTRDPKETKVGCVFDIAVNEYFSSKTGERKSRAVYIPCVVFGESAKFAMEKLQKGMNVYIRGKYDVGRWKDRDGNEQSATRVVVNHLNVVSWPKNEAGDERQLTAANQGGKSSHVNEEENNTDLPF